MKKIYLLLLLCCVGTGAFADVVFQPSTQSAFTGAGTYCSSAPVAVTPLTFTYNTCNGGTGVSSGAACSITWYYNVTNSIVVGTATVAASATAFTSAVTPTGQRTFTPPISIPGAYYYFCVISWTGGTAGCPGGAAGSLTSGTQLVTVNTTPIVGASNVCLGGTLALSDPTGGGVWSSQNGSVAQVSSFGVVTGMSTGNVSIFYSIGGCSAVNFITVNDTPAAITPTTAKVCIGATISLNDGTAGGTWSAVPGFLTVDPATGVVSGVATGTSRVTYKLTGTGCYTTRIVSVNPNPAAITGTTGVCAGSNTPLADITTPGTWSSSNTTVGSVNATSGMVHGTTQGTTTISYTLSTGCYATTTVSVGLTAAPITGAASSVCSGGSTIVLADAVSGGAWTSGSPSNATVSSTGVVTGVNPGAATISYTTPGCGSVTRNIVVNTLPGVITGILNACNGQTNSLSNATTGGTWTSSDTLIARVDTFSGIVSGLSLGTTTISYRLGSSGCAATAIVTVHPLAPILGSDTICVGSTTLLTDIVGGGTWVSSNPANATVNATSGIVTGVVDGITFIVYTTPAACSTSFLLRILPAVPAIAGMKEICSNSISSLSDLYMGGLWTTDNASVAAVSADSGLVSGLFPGTATISYSVYGCGTSSVVTVDPLPAAVISYNWATHTLSTYNYFTHYQWYDSSSGVIPGATNSTLVVSAPINDIYRVLVTDTNGCSKSTVWRDFTAVANVDAVSVNVYPNPATNNVYIESPVKLNAVITGLEGRVLIAQEKVTHINISALPQGIYLLSLSDETGQVITVRKLIKE